jgi:hypothetical protein
VQRLILAGVVAADQLIDLVSVIGTARSASQYPVRVPRTLQKLPSSAIGL